MMLSFHICVFIYLHYGGTLHSWIYAETHAGVQCSIAAGTDVPLVISPNVTINPNIKCNKVWKDAFGFLFGH